MHLLLLIFSMVSTKKYIVLFNMPETSQFISIASQHKKNVEDTEKYFTEHDKIDKRMLNGYSATLCESTVKKLKKNPSVAVVEEDIRVKIAMIDADFYNNVTYENLEEKQIDFILQRNAPWGLSILSGHKTAYEYIPNGGRDVSVYVIDTGIDISHPDFGGRATWGYNAVEGTPDRDEHGHGTHCAGVIGGKYTGIARAANIIAVKALNSREKA